MIYNQDVEYLTSVYKESCAMSSVRIIWTYTANLHNVHADCRLCLSNEQMSQFLFVPTTQLLDYQCQFERRYEHSEQPT